MLLYLSKTLYASVLENTYVSFRRNQPDTLRQQCKGRDIIFKSTSFYFLHAGDCEIY